MVSEGVDDGQAHVAIMRGRSPCRNHFVALTRPRHLTGAEDREAPASGGIRYRRIGGLSDYGHIDIELRPLQSPGGLTWNGYWFALMYAVSLSIAILHPVAPGESAGTPVWVDRTLVPPPTGSISTRTSV